MRVLAHVDLDAFYTQVEVKRNPSLKGKPVVVVQYNPYGDLRTVKPSDNRLFPDSNGSIIAVSYEARAHGVKRNMMAQAAKKLCPELNIVQVPVAHGKADIQIYRDAGAEVISVLSSAAICERASVDEAYLDVTAGAQQLLAAAAAAGGGVAADAAEQAGLGDGTEQQQQDVASAVPHAAAAAGALLPLPESIEGWHVADEEPGAAGVSAWWSRAAEVWTPDELLLAAGAVVVARLRAAVAAQLGFSCSAGIAHSKILAKLGSGLNKPAQQTLVPAAAVPGLLGPLPLPKLRQLGGKFGEELMQGLGVSTVGELAAVPLPRLEALVGLENAAWLQRLAQGKDDEEVKPRTLPKSISCGKTFRGHSALTGLTAVHSWLQQLATELQERLEADRRDHQRMPSQLTVSLDTLAAGAGADAAAAAASTAAAVAAVAGGGGPRATPQNWRAGVAAVSRSTPLRRPAADVMAADALKLVKKWARDRGQGWKIIGMFISASNFVAAPTGASTLDRFMAAGRQQQQQQQQQAVSDSTGTAARAAAPTAGSSYSSGDEEAADTSRQQQQQQHAAGCSPVSLIDRSGSRSSAGRKRPLDVTMGGSRSKAKQSAQGGGLRAFLVPTSVLQQADAAAVCSAHEEAAEGAVASKQQAAAAAGAACEVELHQLQKQQQQQQQQQDGMSMGPETDTPPECQLADHIDGAEVIEEAHAPSDVAPPVHLIAQQHPQQLATQSQQPDLQQQQQQQQPPGTQSQPSQVVVASLGGWLDAAATQQQQHVNLQHSQPQQQQQQQQFDQHCDIVLAPHQQLHNSKNLGLQNSRQPLPVLQAAAAAAAAETAAAAVPGSGSAAAAGASIAQASWQVPELRLSDIDPEVLSELPLELQLEVRRAARAGSAAGGGAGSSRGKGGPGTGRQGRGRGGGRQQQSVQHGSISKYFRKSS